MYAWCLLLQAAVPNITRLAFRSLNAVVVPWVDRGLGNPWPIGAGPVVVETTGRTSGKPRRVPLLSVRFGDSVFVSTLRRDSNWVANLATTPEATVRLFGVDRPATSRVGRIGELQFAELALA
jgi:hypothetical protein